jgi:hypothetical protein
MQVVTWMASFEAGDDAEVATDAAVYIRTY